LTGHTSVTRRFAPNVRPIRRSPEGGQLALAAPAGCNQPRFTAASLANHLEYLVQDRPFQLCLPEKSKDLGNVGIRQSEIEVAWSELVGIGEVM
jgi:hypothetical protein